MPATIQPITIEQVRQAPNIDALMAAYARESARAQLGESQPDWDLYHKLEAGGFLRAFGAFVDDELIGAIFVLLNVVAHYSKLVALTESFFVAPHARKSGAGLLLLAQAEQFAKERGAAALFVSAPVGGRLNAVLRRKGYAATEIFHCKTFRE